MTIFVPKPGPLFRPSRLWHFVAAMAVPVAGGHFFGYQGVGISSLLLVAFIIWEWATPLFYSSDRHPYGDVVDLICFCLGWAAGAGAYLAML